ncbi:glycosyltransferase [Aliarcobacter butzleri]|uniref:glycosyltransferase n=1 Tax=Aliarcobacter butzleri TaxID=28197 RepID=UPI003BB0C711
MKILYLDINVMYHNPTRNNIPFLLKEISELYIYGLGYTSNDLLEKGLNYFHELNGPFDFVVTNEHIVFGSENSQLNDDYYKAYENNYFVQSNLKKLKSIFQEQYKFFKSYSGNKLVFLLESDYYNFQKNKIERLLNCDTYIVGWGESMVAHTSLLEDLEKEAFGKDANNNWYEFIQNNNKIIQIPHFINSSEFYFECLDNRKNLIYIAGVNYYHRKKALEVLKKSKYKIDDKKYYNKIYSLMRKLKIKPDAHPILMRLYNTFFRNEIDCSKYVFTCGSGLEWPIRKFFEIPAAGSLLLAKPFYNSEKLGFIDGENFIKTDYNDIEDKIKWLEENPQIAQKIAKNGQDLIWKLHSLSARADQFKHSLDSIMENRFAGTYWKNGEFYLK